MLLWLSICSLRTFYFWYIFCPSGIKGHIPNHVKLNGSFVHCSYTVLWKVCFHGQPSYMYNILEQLSRKVGKALLRYCCSSLHRKVVLIHEFRQQTITINKSSYQQIFTVTTFFIMYRFSFKHDKFSRNTLHIRTSLLYSA